MAKDYSTAYRAYDIRSVWQKPIDGTFSYALGKGIGLHLVETIGKDATFIFAADVREANNELVYWFLKGLEEGGCTQYVGIGLPVESVDDEQEQLRGVASTMMLYYCTQSTFDMGCIFTASHNPAEWVGMKIVDRNAMLVESEVLSDMVEAYRPVSQEIDEEDMERIRHKAMGENNPLHTLIEGKIQTFSSLLASRFDELERKYKFVVDFSNGSASGYERIFLEEIVALGGHEVIFLNEKADSNFTQHLSDTTDPHDYKQLVDEVQKQHADFGILFDGDADRLGCVDEQGTMIGGDILAGMIAINMLKRGGSKKKVIHDVFFTKAILEEIRMAGGEPIKSRVGHRFVKDLFKKEQALFGGELSAHLFFDEVGGFECPLLALYYLMDEFSNFPTVSSAILPYMKYYKPPLKKYQLTQQEDADKIFIRIKEYYKAYTLDDTDGIGVYGDDFWFVIRGSNTEPVLKMVMEADNKDIRELRSSELATVIGK